MSAQSTLNLAVENHSPRQQELLALMPTLTAEKRAALDRILTLRSEITEHDLRYGNNQPSITDGEYDALMRQLVTLEAEHPEFEDAESPTQRIIEAFVDGLEKVAHESPMLSLDKVNDEAGLRKFAARMKGRLLAQLKLDGLTIVLTYVNGILEDAVTRGNGRKGERVLHTIRTIKSVPKTIPFKGKLVVRGEVYLPFKEFERLNTTGEYSNVRNLASGLVRRLDAKPTAEAGLEVSVYDLVQLQGFDQTFERDDQQLSFLEQQNFQVVDYIAFDSVDDLVTYCLAFDKPRTDENGQQLPSLRQALTFQIDGLVVKLNNLAARAELGMTSKGPRWGHAYKFESPEERTIERGIQANVSRSGELSVVALFDPVDLGVEVKQSTLHNIGKIWEKDIRVGDEIIVSRRNDVIPHVEKVITPWDKLDPQSDMHEIKRLKELRRLYGELSELEAVRDRLLAELRKQENEDELKAAELDALQVEIGTLTAQYESKIVPVQQSISGLRKADDTPEVIAFVSRPKYTILECPSCGSEVEQDGIHIYCRNLSCPPQRIRQIEHFGKRDSMNIDGMAESIVEELIDNDLIHTVADLYRLNDRSEKLAQLKGWGKQRVNKLLAAIEATKTAPLSNLLRALGMQHVGRTQGKQIADHFKTMDGVMAGSKAAFAEALGIKPGSESKKATAIYKWFRNQENRDLIDDLRSLGLNMEEPQGEALGDSLAGKSFVITGTLSKDRKEFETIIKAHGGKVTGSVSAKMKENGFLLMGDDAEGKNKHQDAMKHGVSIISEAEFNAMMI